MSPELEVSSMDLNVSFFLVDDDVFLLYFALILFAFTPINGRWNGMWTVRMLWTEYVMVCECVQCVFYLSLLCPFVVEIVVTTWSFNLYKLPLFCKWLIMTLVGISIVLVTRLLLSFYTSSVPMDLWSSATGSANIEYLCLFCDCNLEIGVHGENDKWSWPEMREKEKKPQYDFFCDWIYFCPLPHPYFLWIVFVIEWNYIECVTASAFMFVNLLSTQ